VFVVVDGLNEGRRGKVTKIVEKVFN